MLGALMYCSKVLMEALPNIHLLGMFILTFTVAFRQKALIPLYIYVFLDGLFSGFAIWWVPYLYIWTVLWGAAMLLPKRMPPRAGYIVYPILGFLHGLAFGTLYAPVQALAFGLDWEGTLAWIAAGLPFDLIHGISNFCTGFLVVPLSRLLGKLMQGRG